MIVQYGTYAHDDNECQVTVARQSWRDADGQRRGYTERWTLSGMLRGAGADLVADLTTKIAALKAAYDEDDLDLVLYESDGSTETGHTLKTADTVGGTTVISGPSFPSGRGAEYATYRNYTITIEAKVEDTDNDLISFVEVVSTVGTGDSRFAIHTPFVGAPVVQITAESTPVFVSQDGSAIGRALYPNIPAPVSLSSEHQDRRRVTRKSAERLPDGTWRNYEISWHYEFSTVSPSITGSPSFSVGVSAVSHMHDDRYYTEAEIDTWRASTTQTEMGYVHGVTSDIQTQLDGKAAVGHDFDTHSGDLDLVDLGDYAQGSLIVGGAANWVALAKGTAGQVPMSDGTDLAYSTTFTADMLFASSVKAYFSWDGVTGAEYITSGANTKLDAYFGTGMRFYNATNLVLTIKGYPGYPAIQYLDTPVQWNFAVGGTIYLRMLGNDILPKKEMWFDAVNLVTRWGTAAATGEIFHNGTNFIIDPAHTGSGKVYFGPTANEDICAANYFLGTSATEYITAPAADIGRFMAAAYWQVGDGAPTHISGTANSFHVSGQLEVDNIAWFDTSVRIDGHLYPRDDLIFLSGAGDRGVVALVPNWTHQQFVIGLRIAAPTHIGHQMIIASSGWTAKDFDHPPQTHPTWYGQDDRDPDISNNAWYSIVHDATGMLISTGPNIGAGSAPATIDNYISFMPRGVEALRLTGDGGAEFRSGMSVEQATISAPATLTAAHYIVLCDTDTAGAPFTVTLPPAASHAGRVYEIVNIGTSGFDVTVDGDGAEEISHALTQDVADGECLAIVCDGAAWWVRG